MLGGRYGSLEPETGKSYVELEYDYAVAQKRKPYVSLVVKPDHHDARVREHGLKVDERAHPDKYRAFYQIVTSKHCAFWADKKDIQAAIFRKLPEWAQNDNLKGWIRAEDAASPALASELAKLSEENRELRNRMRENRAADDFEGLQFEEVVTILKGQFVPSGSAPYVEPYASPESTPRFLLVHAGHLFERLQDKLAIGVPVRRSEDDDILQPLLALGLVEKDYRWEPNHYLLTQSGRRFRNRLLLSGPIATRLQGMWATESERL